MRNKKRQGFTLIELLIVIGIIAILAGVVLVAINPGALFQQAQDTGRKADASNLLKAFYAASASPTAAGALPQCLWNDGGGGGVALHNIPECDGGDGDADLFDGALPLGSPADTTYMDCTDALTPSYLREMPIDPDTTYTAANSGYSVCQDTSGATPILRVLSLGAQQFTDDGGCEHPDGSGDPVLCVSG